jgi:hypothetical protein
VHTECVSRRAGVRTPNRTRVLHLADLPRERRMLLNAALGSSGLRPAGAQLLGSVAAVSEAPRR